jgi:hypothetical protein
MLVSLTSKSQPAFGRCQGCFFESATHVRICARVAQHLGQWLWIVRREKSTDHTLNLFRADVGNFLRGQDWILKDSFLGLGTARAALDPAQDILNIPPTHRVFPAAPSFLFLSGGTCPTVNPPTRRVQVYPFGGDQ